MDDDGHRSGRFRLYLGNCDRLSPSHVVIIRLTPAVINNYNPYHWGVHGEPIAELNNC